MGEWRAPSLPFFLFSLVLRKRRRTVPTGFHHSFLDEMSNVGCATIRHFCNHGCWGGIEGLIILKNNIICQQHPKTRSSYCRNHIRFWPDHSAEHLTLDHTIASMELLKPSMIFDCHLVAGVPKQFSDHIWLKCQGWCRLFWIDWTFAQDGF